VFVTRTELAADDSLAAIRARKRFGIAINHNQQLNQGKTLLFPHAISLIRRAPRALGRSVQDSVLKALALLRPNFVPRKTMLPKDVYKQQEVAHHIAATGVTVFVDARGLQVRGSRWSIY
jgi:hypothetical protein